MLTQGPALDPKCQLNVSLFYILPHLLDCLIFTRNAMSIVFLLQMMEGWDRWGVVDLYCDVSGGRRGGYHLIVFVFSDVFDFSSFMSSVPLFRGLEHDGCCVCFFVFSWFSLFLVPLGRSYWCIETAVSDI